MKKIFLIAGALVLLAAGCNKAVQPNAQQPVTTGTQTFGQEEQQSSKEQAAQIKINNVDEAVNAIEKSSSNEQSVAAGSDDSDLTESDSASLSSLTEVPNAK